MLNIFRHLFLRTHMALSKDEIRSAAALDRAEKTGKRDTIQADGGPYGSVSCYFA